MARISLKQGVQTALGLMIFGVWAYVSWFDSPYHEPYVYKNWNELQQQYVALMADILVNEKEPDDVEIYNRQRGVVYRQVAYHHHDQAMFDRITKNAINHGWQPMPSDFDDSTTFHACKDGLALEIFAQPVILIKMSWSGRSECQKAFSKSQSNAQPK